ncbi:hypothetical protein HNP73_001666 [Amaricoccus macauensis]|uniref:DUF4174 domain-containing protein n=1 Tax=Amaricoccus macauensis TaxID=57001 RepID=A0A840SLW6_9RHOB|nr:DUF4174 domain-containing protein [Amaricoccus macauensis]MBB5221730.1 hypothetical protein [Amaricoccus macauensis]
MQSALATVIVALLAPLVALADETPAPTLEDLSGQSRAVVVFADTPDDPKFVQQIRWLDAEPEPLEDRRVVVLTDTDPEAKGPLRQRLRPSGFGLVLIDLDGAIAQRRPMPTSVRELVNFIDRMPSRRLETGSHRP